MRQQLLCADRADYTVWTDLCPAVLPLAVALCPATFGRNVDCAFSALHVVSSFRKCFRRRLSKSAATSFKRVAVDGAQRSAI
jgi:hypothetical protein